MSGQEKAKVVIKLGQLNKIDDLKVIVENLEEDEVSSMGYQQELQLFNSNRGNVSKERYYPPNRVLKVRM